jgi:citrate/tricarballylate utilization protein
MTPLQALIEEAEVDRVLQICNACRYCESYCAVFPAMTRRLNFNPADVHYLANLCHNCGACLHSCQYAAPHEFAVNVPIAMSRVRAKTYATHAWPAAMSNFYSSHGLALSLAIACALALMLMWAALLQGSLFGAAGGASSSFYAVFPHGVMVGLFAPIFAFAALALGMGVRQFWRGAAPGSITAPSLKDALHKALSLKYLDGGHGMGCNNEDDAWTLWRRRWHHAVFYGFALCFAATTLATIYHYVLHWSAPYPLALAWVGLPKLLGTVGGVLMCFGSVGLWVLHGRRNPAHVDVQQRSIDQGCASTWAP